MNVLNDNIFMWNLNEMLAAAYRIKQEFILVKHKRIGRKIRETDNFAALFIFTRAVFIV